MDTTLLENKFTRIGARLKIGDLRLRRSRTPGLVSLDVRADRRGEFFEIVKQPGGRCRGRRPRRSARRPPPAPPRPGGQGEEQILVRTR